MGDSIESHSDKPVFTSSVSEQIAGIVFSFLGLLAIIGSLIALHESGFNPFSVTGLVMGIGMGSFGAWMLKRV